VEALFNKPPIFSRDMADESGMQWEYNIPLLTNRYMLKDMAKLFLVTFILETTILLIATGFEYESLITLSLLGEAIFIGLFIFTSLILGNILARCSYWTRMGSEQRCHAG